MENIQLELKDTAAPESTEETRVRWTTNEWLKVAAQLHKDYPDFELLNPTTWHNNFPRISAFHVIEAARRCLPEDRHRNTLNVAKAKNVLRKAFEQLQGTPALLTATSTLENAAETKPIVSAGKVMWSINERKRLVARLEDLYPGVMQNGATGLTHDQMREAQNCLPQERRRAIGWMTHEQKMLSRVFKDMDPLALTALKKKVHEEMEPQEPEEPQQAEVEGIAVQQIPAEVSSEQFIRKFVRWSFTELVTIAREIHRRNQLALYPYKEHLAGLHAEEVRMAQRVLPEDRQRKITTMVGLREQLAEAMKIVRAEIEHEKAKKEADDLELSDQSAKDAELPTVPNVTAEPVADELDDADESRGSASAPPVAVSPVAPAPSTPQAPTLPSLGEQLAGAARPFLRALWQECADAVVPKLAEVLMPKIEEIVLNYLTTPVQSAAVTDVEPVAPEEPEPATPAQTHNAYHDDHSKIDPLELGPPAHYRGVEGIVHRPQVAIIGPKSAVGRLEDTFPFIDFYFIERGKADVPHAISNCEKIIGVANFITEPVRNEIRKTPEGKEKFTVVHGSTSAVERQINLWLNAGILTTDEKRYQQLSHH